MTLFFGQQGGNRIVRFSEIGPAFPQCWVVPVFLQEQGLPIGQNHGQVKP
jgi:hypothetical protein